MNVSELFIRKPTATTLLTVAIALSGAVAFQLLPVSPLPPQLYGNRGLVAALYPKVMSGMALDALPGGVFPMPALRLV